MKIATLYAEFRAQGLGTVHAGMASLHGSLVKMEASLNRLGHVSRVAFMGLATAGAGAVYAFMKGEKELALVSTMLSGKDMQWMPAYEQGLSKLSESTGESMANLAKGLYDVLSATVAPEKAMGVLAAAAKAAIGGATNTATATNAIVAVLNSYKIGAEDVIDVTDKLQMTVNRGVMTYEQFASSIGKAAATSAIAGVSLNELLASVATITRAGLNSDEAMTAVVGVLQTFLKPTEEAKKLAKELGFELDTATLKAEGLSGVFKKLNGLLAEQLSELFPNIRGLKGVAAAMQDAAGFAKDLELITNSSGAAQEAYGKMSETTAHQIAQLRAEFMNLARDIGKALIPSVRELTKSISDFMATVGTEQTATIIKWGLALAGIGIILPKLATGIKLLSGAMLSLLANPIVASIVAIGAAFAAMGYLITKALEPVSDSKDMEKALKDQKSRIFAAQNLLTELRTINSKEILTNDERKRAIGLAKELTKEYGNLGLKVDAITGKIIGVNSAEKQLVELFQGSLIRSINADLRQQKEIAKNAENKIYGAEKYEGDLLRARVPGYVESQRDILKNAKQRIKELEKELDNALQGDAPRTPEQEELTKLGVKAKLEDDKKAKLPSEGYLKQLEENRTGAEQAAQQLIEARFGDIPGASKVFSLEMARKKLRRDEKAEQDALETAVNEKKIKGPEAEVLIEAIRNKYSFLEQAITQEQLRLPVGMPGSELEDNKKIQFDSGSWKGLAEVWKDVQSAVLKKDPQTEELKKQTEFLKELPKIVTKLDKLRATAS